MPQDIKTASGLYFDLQDPRVELIKLEDIAAALSKICRFTGHTRQFYSVAEHSWRCSYLVPPELAAQALLHDAAEAYLGDVSRPLKALLPDYKRLEVLVEAAIAERFGLPDQLDPAIKVADNIMLATEKRDLMTRDQAAWRDLKGVRPVGQVDCFGPDVARDLFLRRAAVLGVV